jgi:hypothetical protein
MKSKNPALRCAGCYVLSQDARPVNAPCPLALTPNHRFALIAVPLMTATDFAGPPICEGPVP